MDAEMPQPSRRPAQLAAALMETLDAANRVAELTGDDDPRTDRQRAGLLELVLIDYRAFIATTRSTASVNPAGITRQQ